MAASVRSNASMLMNQKVVSPSSAARARQQQQQQQQQLLVQQPQQFQQSLLSTHSPDHHALGAGHGTGLQSALQMNLAVSSGRFVPTAAASPTAASAAGLAFTPAASVRSLRSHVSANVSQSGSLRESLGGFRNVETGEGANLYVDTTTSSTAGTGTATLGRDSRGGTGASSGIKMHKLSGTDNHNSSASFRRSASGTGRSFGSSRGSAVDSPRGRSPKSRSKPRRPFY